MRIFTAPMDTEVEVARNMHDLVRVLGPGKGKDVKVCGWLWVTHLSHHRPSSLTVVVVLVSVQNPLQDAYGGQIFVLSTEYA